MTQQLHWHGYGPYRGRILTRDDEPKRRTNRAAAANDEIPPMQLGHYLTSRRATAAERTWTDVNQALDWLAQVAADNPPAGSYALITDNRPGKRAQLLGGSDIYHQYYTGTSSMAAYAIICCPHAHLTVTCPLPPATPTPAAAGG